VQRFSPNIAESSIQRQSSLDQFAINRLTVVDTNAYSVARTPVTRFFFTKRSVFADFQADLCAGDMRLPLTPILLKNVVHGFRLVHI
jgi:hypothetical protein